MAATYCTAGAKPDECAVAHELSAVSIDSTPHATRRNRPSN